MLSEINVVVAQDADGLADALQPPRLGRFACRMIPSGWYPPAEDGEDERGRKKYSKLIPALNSINSAVEILGGKNRFGRPRKRRMSASARARIAKAKRARWAKVRAAKKNA